jgi:transposase
VGAIILAEYGDFSNFSNPNQLLKFAGLEPSVYESGNYKADKVKMVKRGSPYLRWALLEAARLAAIRDNVFRDYMLKKVGEGKHFYVARSHVARKLVRVIFSLIKNDQVFNRELSLSAA